MAIRPLKNQRLLSLPLGLTIQTSSRSAHTVILLVKYCWIFIALVKKHPLLQIAQYRQVISFNRTAHWGPDGVQAILHQHTAQYQFPVFIL
jgi:hypothetical protein